MGGGGLSERGYRERDEDQRDIVRKFGKDRMRQKERE